MTSRTITAHTARLLTAVAAALCLCAVTVAGGANAAERGYRYWNFWVVDAGSWALPEVTPQERQLADFDVDGWHFGVWGDDGGAPPRSVTAFRALCPALAAREAQPGTARVAVVIDPGVAGDAPDGESPSAIRTVCLRMPGGSTSRDALERAASSVRIESNAVCAIGGYPSTECAPRVGESSGTPQVSVPTATDSGLDGNGNGNDEGTTQESQQAAWQKAAPIAMAVVGSMLLVGGVVIALRRAPRRRTRR